MLEPSAKGVGSKHGHSEASEQVLILKLCPELPDRHASPVSEGPSYRGDVVGVRRVQRKDGFGEVGSRFEDVGGGVSDL